MNCPSCNRLIYSRTHKTCDFCGVDLPPAVLLSKAELAVIKAEQETLENRRAEAKAKREEARKKRAAEGGVLAMSVSDTVRTLSQLISAGINKLSAHERLLLALLELMPLYCENGILDAWEAAYGDTATGDEDTSQVSQLADEVFEFGRLNLYAAFRPEETKSCYSELSGLFENAGLVCPVIDEFPDL